MVGVAGEATTFLAPPGVLVVDFGGGGLREEIR